MGESRPFANLLYVRRNGRIKGPYAAGAVRDFLARKQLLASDEVSADQRHWVSAVNMDKVLHQPDAATSLSLPEQRRRASARAAQAGPLGVLERRGRLPFPKKTLAVMTGVFTVVILGGIWLGRPDRLLPPMCDASAIPSVVWRSCALDGIRAPDSDLQQADLRAAHLRGADLSRSNLDSANAAYAFLERANLSHASLVSANLKGADLTGADLTYADLSGADLSHADLTGARLGGVSMSGTRLRNTIWADGGLCNGEGPEACLLPQDLSQAKDSVSYR
ncbi:MAG TPA: pentapeptide repeat-containing protein [Chromatiales bacterium]|nr:pentapeptide repeat-containing protein [Chromatiales bacterium]